MDNVEFVEILERQITLTREVLVGKAREYASDVDRLHNFKVAAEIIQSTPLKALWGMEAKHLTSLSDMVNSEKSYPAAVWDEKIGDSINYLILLRALVVDERVITES